MTQIPSRKEDRATAQSSAMDGLDAPAHSRDMDAPNTTEQSCNMDALDVAAQPRTIDTLDAPAFSRTRNAARIMIAATASGVGKTSLACGIMRALQRRGHSVQACKCGPDYIDPGFHRSVVGAPSRNLDLFFSSENTVRRLVAEGTQAAAITIIEGAMGYYDGIAQSDSASSYALAHATQTPVVLVVDGRGRALSAAAEIAGFLQFRNPSHIAGVIFSRVSAAYYPRLKHMAERETGIPVLGFLPVLEDCNLESRHLGLIRASEVDNLQDKVNRIAHAVEEHVDLDALVQLAQLAPTLAAEQPELPTPCTGSPRIAVAIDSAFSFYYHDVLHLFEQLGATIVPFSPLQDSSLPENTAGIYLGGGYPELHARALSENTHMRKSIQSAIVSGMPTIAECGGFMYLHDSLEDNTGELWPMVGAIAGSSRKQNKLSRFGYVNLQAKRACVLCDANDSLPAHEFHYWDSDNPGSDFTATKPQSSRSWDCVFATPTLYAGYPHLYLYDRPDCVRRFLDACTNSYRERNLKMGR